MQMRAVRVVVLVLASLGCACAQSPSTQSKLPIGQPQASEQPNKSNNHFEYWTSDDASFLKTAWFIGASDQVCYSTCKYKGDSGTYLGAAGQDDTSCSAACGAARRKCSDANDTNCKYVDNSCRYTNCSTED
jgi:hypothetical protein